MPLGDSSAFAGIMADVPAPNVIVCTERPVSVPTKVPSVKYTFIPTLNSVVALAPFMSTAVTPEACE